MTALFVSFGAKSLYCGGKFVQDENGNPTLLKGTNFSFQTYTNSTICKFLWTSTLSSQGKFVQGPLNPTAIA
jgi:hypothetical protein